MGVADSFNGLAALVAVFAILNTSAVITRFVVRWKQKQGFNLDDWCIVPAWLCFIGVEGLMIWGLTSPSADIRFVDGKLVATGTPGIEIFAIKDILANLALGFIRLSALFFFRRLFVTPAKSTTFGKFTATLIGATCFGTVSLLVIQVYGCAADNFSINSNYSYLESFAVGSFVLDALVIILPMPVIWKLHTTIGRKVGITAVFLLAAGGGAISCARTVVTSYGPSHYDYTKILFFLILEVGLGLFAVNLPSLWYLFKDVTLEGIQNRMKDLISPIHAKSFDTDLQTRLGELDLDDFGIMVRSDFTVDSESYLQSDQDESRSQENR